MKYFSSIVIVLFFTNCVDIKLPADLLITNANIYTVNENFDTAASFVVKDGLILEIGKDSALALKYTATNTYDAAGKTIVKSPAVAAFDPPKSNTATAALLKVIPALSDVNGVLL